MLVAGLVVTLSGCRTENATDEGDFAADVVGARVTGNPSAYTFYVTVRSDETGCDRYADWWELLTPEGALVYRRVLDHSHPDEQPFERSGGPVDVGADDPLVVRAHLHPQGYGGAALSGTAGEGFAPTTLEDGFAAALETTPPLPASCLF